MTHYNKLVRDNIPDKLDKKGVAYEKRIASEEEYRIELCKKLTEEVNEFQEVHAPEELADIIEVVEALKKLPDFKDVEKIREDKFILRGGFEKRIILSGEK